MSDLDFQMASDRRPRHVKFLARNRKNFGFSEYLAFCAVTSAIRKFRRSKSFAVALILPADVDVNTYFRAAEAFMNPDPAAYRRTMTMPHLFNPKSPSLSMKEALEALAKERSILIFGNEDEVPADIQFAVDEVAQLRSPSIRDVHGAVRWIYDDQVNPEIASLMLETPESRLRAIMRPGRSLSGVIQALNRKLPKQRKPHDDRPRELRLENLSGYGEARQWGITLARDIADYKAGKIRWADVDVGLLISGAPGTGKTIFAAALAATCEVPLIHASAARWQSKGHLGDFLKAMVRSFEDARKAAPSILFVDEVDSFGSRDGDHGHNENYVRQAVNGFLEQLDGSMQRTGVVVVGACNSPALLDPAIMRSGRLDRHIRIPLPDEEARAGIFRTHLTADVSAEDFIEFARETKGLTGADIYKIIREARRVARTERRELNAADVRRVLPLKLTIPPKNLFASAVHELGHAIVGLRIDFLDLEYVKLETAIYSDKTKNTLGFASFAENHWVRRTRQHYIDHISMLLAGIAAEQVVFGEHEDGAAGVKGSDLEQATTIALCVEGHFGMGNSLTSDESLASFLKYARQDQALMERANRILIEQLARAKAIVEEDVEV